MKRRPFYGEGEGRGANPSARLGPVRMASHRLAFPPPPLPVDEQSVEQITPQTQSELRAAEQSDALLFIERSSHRSHAGRRPTSSSSPSRRSPAPHAAVPSPSPASIASCRAEEGGADQCLRCPFESPPTASAASWWIPSELKFGSELKLPGELMYGSPVSKDLNLPVQPPMTSSGLLRYRSAPSTVLGDLCEDLRDAGGADNVFSRFLADHHHHHHIRDDKPSPPPPPPPPPTAHFPSAADMASQQHQHQQMMFQSHSQSQQQQQMVDASKSGGLYRTVSSGMEAAAAAAGGTGAGVGAGSNLIRQSSSPAGFLDHFSMDNGYGAMLRASMGMGFRDGVSGGGTTDSLAGGGRLKGQLSFSSRQGSLMSQISEMDSEEVGGSSPEAGPGGRGGYIPGYPMSSAGWDDSSSALMSDSLSGMKPARDSSEQQQQNRGGGLAHQFSLPKTSSEMAAIEKFLQFQDAVPCKIRAKRGCATHPRSIAERVRRTKISERIRKLQELVPNMDKQTNTSDMLDLAVDYIKDLQKQVKALNESRATCTCPAASKHQQFSG